MPLNPSKLADEIKAAAGQGDKDTTVVNLQFATAIVSFLQTGVVSFLPGTITGTAPPSGGPLIAGEGSGGMIVLVPAAFMPFLALAFGPPTPQVLGMANGMAAHFLTGTVSFTAGQITGACANTPTTPGPLVGVGAGGKIGGLSGSGMAKLWAAGIGQTSASPELQKMSDAIVKHVMDNATVSLAVVSGLCSAGGGPITLGAGTGGTIL
jgi:hypothetical protein